MRRLFIFLLLFASCRQEERPKDVLSQAQFSALLVEMYLAEARTETALRPRDSAFNYFLPQETKILKKLNISDSAVRKSYVYYMDHPKELELIYDSVIDTLSLREQRANKVPGVVKPSPLKKPAPKPLILH